MSDPETNPLLRLLPRVILCQPLDGQPKNWQPLTKVAANFTISAFVLPASVTKVAGPTNGATSWRVLMIPLIG